MCVLLTLFFFFFFNDTATTEIYTLSLHDALPICAHGTGRRNCRARAGGHKGRGLAALRDFLASRGHVRAAGEAGRCRRRSEEHTSELQSQSNLVCRLLLEKKKKTQTLR